MPYAFLFSGIGGSAVYIIDVNYTSYQTIVYCRTLMPCYKEANH